jgi:predicted DNA-binding transcriptional regulator YafY
MRADRLLKMVLLLQTRGKLTSQTLADELGVSRRTILRDLEALSLAGIPVYAEGGHHGGIALDEDYRTTLTGLGEAEIRSLFIASSASVLADLGLGEAAERSLLKLSASLPARYQPSVEHIRQRIHIDPVWWWHDGAPMPFWAEIQQAVYEDRRIRALYENYSGEVSERELEPYSLVSKSSFWYLIAKRGEDLRTYRVSRFRQVALLDEHFQRDSTFDLPTYWREHLDDFRDALSEYTVTLRIHASRISFATSLLPGRYQVIAEDGDWNTVKFQIESMDLARMLVFGLGKHAVVVDPPDLRQSVLDAAREIIAADHD